jgi:hypothetical protein
MMQPDLALIAEVMLQSEGFQNSRPLAKKTVTLYALMQQQLSKQASGYPNDLNRPLCWCWCVFQHTSFVCPPSPPLMIAGPL